MSRCLFLGNGVGDALQVLKNIENMRTICNSKIKYGEEVGKSKLFRFNAVREPFQINSLYSFK